MKQFGLAATTTSTATALLTPSSNDYDPRSDVNVLPPPHQQIFSSVTAKKNDSQTRDIRHQAVDHLCRIMNSPDFSSWVQSSSCKEHPPGTVASFTLLPNQPTVVTSQVPPPLMQWARNSESLCSSGSSLHPVNVALPLSQVRSPLPLHNPLQCFTTTLDPRVYPSKSLAQPDSERSSSSSMSNSKDLFPFLSGHLTGKTRVTPNFTPATSLMAPCTPQRIVTADFSSSSAPACCTAASSHLTLVSPQSGLNQLQQLPSEVVVKKMQCLGAKCPHVSCWKRLRARKGFVYFSCLMCGVHWHIPSRRTSTFTARALFSKC